LGELKTSIDEMDNAINALAHNQGKINQNINAASAELSLINLQLPTFKNDIQIAAAKLNSINEDDISELIAFSDMNLSDVGNYFESPVELGKKHIYHIDNYGSAIAPFYIVLSLWIGGIVAVAMMKMTVRSRKKYHSTTVYLGRMGIFLIISILQALTVAIGAIFLNVQVSSALLFILTILYIGIGFMVILYSLTSSFGNLGKALAVIFLVLQIAAAGGTFPVEVLPPFFQAIHPYLPFTYAISALREVIAGVLWSNYRYCIVILAIFPTVALILTLLIKEKLSKRAEWAEEKLKGSGLF
jgi:putative membrane protein